MFEQNEDVSVIGEVRMDETHHEDRNIIFLTVNGMAHSSGD